MSRDELQGLDELLQDVIDSDLPDPELLARYATAPNELTSEEREQVETAMRRSPAVVDELDTLRGFDFGALNADLEAAEGRSLWAWLIGLSSMPAVWAGLAAAAALLLWIAIGGVEFGQRDTAGQAPLLAEGSGPPQEEDGLDPEMPDPTIIPAPAPAPLEEAIERLADEDRAIEPDVLADADRGPAPEEEPSVERPETIAAVEPSAPVYPDVPPAPQEPEAAPAEREILVAMVIPDYTQPIDAVARERVPFVYRSPGESWPFITTLSPAHVARSTSVQPDLVWSIDRLPSRGAFYLTVSGPGDDSLVENQRLPSPMTSGIQETSLATLGVELKREVEYRWSISHRLDEEAPPTHYAFGWVKVVEMKAAERERLEKTVPGARPDVLARAGYWYDALQATLDMVARHPLDERPRAALRALLEQGGITDVSF